MPTRLRQADLFAVTATVPGFQYAPDVLDAAAERRFVAAFERLPFAPFQFHGYEGNRRVVSFGWRYDYSQRRIQPSQPLPPILEELRALVAGWAGRRAEAFVQALVTEYRPGAGIGWHRDKPAFGEVAALSFLSPCTLRFRRAVAEGWDRQSLAIAPRSAYFLSGAAREVWEHSIPPQETLRYSVTFRTLVAP